MIGKNYFKVVGIQSLILLIRIIQGFLYTPISFALVFIVILFIYQFQSLYPVTLSVYLRQNIFNNDLLRSIYAYIIFALSFLISIFEIYLSNKFQSYKKVKSLLIAIIILSGFMLANYIGTNSGSTLGYLILNLVAALISVIAIIAIFFRAILDEAVDNLAKKISAEKDMLV